MDKDISNLVSKDYSSQKEVAERARLLDLFKNSPLPDEEILKNLGLFIRRQYLMRMLFMHEIYQKQLPVHGVVMEFGTRWGQNLALFESFRGMYEPYNHNRKLIGFDTFAGFPSVHEKDGGADIASAGKYAVTENYEAYLEQILSYHEQENPISHLKKFQLIKGDASVELEKYLTDHPETIISLAYFDFDIYEPTKKCLQLIKNHITRGTVIGFDELNVRDFPGETIAVKEELGLLAHRIHRSQYSSVNSYIVIE